VQYNLNSVESTVEFKSFNQLSTKHAYTRCFNSYFYVFAIQQCRLRHYVFQLSVRHVHPFARSSGQNLLPQYLMNYLSNLETYRE